MAKAKASKAKRKKKALAGRGRPRKTFSQALALRLLKLAQDGATDRKLAAAAGVSLRTFQNWKNRHPDFLHALKDAKSVADELVEASLYMRAVGYSHPAIKFFCHEGVITSKKYVERYAPDVTACIYWLKNRQPKRWRDRFEHTGADGEQLQGPQVIVSMPSNGREAR